MRRTGGYRERGWKVGGAGAEWWYLHDRALGAIERGQYRFLENPGKFDHSLHPDPSNHHIKLSITPPLPPSQSPAQDLGEPQAPGLTSSHLSSGWRSDTPRHPEEGAHCKEDRVSPRPLGKNCLCLCGPGHDTCRKQTRQISRCPWLGDREERGPARAPFPGPQRRNSRMRCPAPKWLGTPSSPSWKETTVWSLAGPSLPRYVTASKSGPGNGAMQSSSLSY